MVFFLSYKFRQLMKEVSSFNIGQWLLQWRSEWIWVSVRIRFYQPHWGWPVCDCRSCSPNFRIWGSKMFVLFNSMTWWSCSLVYMKALKQFKIKAVIGKICIVIWSLSVIYCDVLVAEYCSPSFRIGCDVTLDKVEAWWSSSSQVL